MGLPIRQQWSLRCIEYSLRRSDPNFAVVMCTFAVFALDGKVPEHERLASRTLWGCQVVIGATMRVFFMAVHSARMSAGMLQRLAVRLAKAFKGGARRQAIVTAGSQVSENGTDRPLLS